jgi:hypothetical protein
MIDDSISRIVNIPSRGMFDRQDSLRSDYMSDRESSRYGIVQQASIESADSRLCYLTSSEVSHSDFALPIPPKCKIVARTRTKSTPLSHFTRPDLRHATNSNEIEANRYVPKANSLKIT